MKKLREVRGPRGRSLFELMCACRPKEMEDFARRLAALPRSELIHLLRGMHCPFPMDFTDEFLEGMSIERLRHVVLAASLHACGLARGRCGPAEAPAPAGGRSR